MRVFLRVAIAALVFVAAFSGRSSAQTAQKLAYIRSSAVLEQAPGRVEAEAQLDRETGVYRAEIKRMSDSLNTLAVAFDKVAASLSPTARAARTTDLQTKQADYQRRTQALEQRAQQRQAELAQPIYDRVKLAIEDVRVEGGYSFVFNNDQGTPIMAADKNLDITDRVIAKLRSAPAVVARPASSAPAPGAPAPAPAGVTRPAAPPQD